MSDTNPNMHETTNFEPGILPQFTPFQPVLSRIQVPVSPDFPEGEAVLLRFYTVIGGPFCFFFDPKMAASVGEGLITVAGQASGLVMPNDDDLRRFTG